MAKITISDVDAGFNLASSINARFQQIQDELNNKVLYRDNPAGEPNQLTGDVDLNNNDILNAGTIGATDLLVGGSTINQRLQDTLDAAEQAQISETNANSSAIAAANSATASSASAAAAATSASNADASAASIIGDVADAQAARAGAEAAEQLASDHNVAAQAAAAQAQAIRDTLPTDVVEEAPNDGQQYARQSEGWAAVTVPTAVSELTNDAGYITDAGVTSVNGNTGAVTVNEFTDAPSDGSQYARQDGAWSVVTGGGGSLTVQDEGIDLTTAASTLNFTGDGVTATESSGTVTIDIPAASSGGGGGAIALEQDGTQVQAAASTLNFQSPLTVNSDGDISFGAAPDLGFFNGPLAPLISAGDAATRFVVTSSVDSNFNQEAGGALDAVIADNSFFSVTWSGVGITPGFGFAAETEQVVGVMKGGLATDPETASFVAGVYAVAVDQGSGLEWATIITESDPVPNPPNPVAEANGDIVIFFDRVGNDLYITNNGNRTLITSEGGFQFVATSLNGSGSVETHTITLDLNPAKPAQIPAGSQPASTVGLDPINALPTLVPPATDSETFDSADTTHYSFTPDQLNRLILSLQPTIQDGSVATQAGLAPAGDSLEISTSGNHNFTGVRINDSEFFLAQTGTTGNTIDARSIFHYRMVNGVPELVGTAASNIGSASANIQNIERFTDTLFAVTVNDTTDTTQAYTFDGTTLTPTGTALNLAPFHTARISDTRIVVGNVLSNRLQIVDWNGTTLVAGAFLNDAAGSDISDRIRDIIVTNKGGTIIGVADNANSNGTLHVFDVASNGTITKRSTHSSGIDSDILRISGFGVNKFYVQEFSSWGDPRLFEYDPLSDDVRPLDTTSNLVQAVEAPLSGTNSFFPLNGDTMIIASTSNNRSRIRGIQLRDVPLENPNL